MADNDIITAIISIGVIVVVLAFIIYASSIIVGTSDNTAEDKQTAALLDGERWIEIDDTVGLEETVYTSRGYALNLTGASDSYFESTDAIQLDTSENWTVSAWGAQNTVTSEKQALLSVKGEIVISYYGAANNWSVWFYDSSRRNSYNFSVNATERPDELTNIVVTRTNDTLSLYENATQLYSKDISNESIVDSPDAENWDGRIEEVRVWQRAINTTVQSTHNTNPIDPIPTNATARVMFDEPYRENQLLLYNTGSVETSNATFSNGFSGEKLERDGLLGGDYKWRDNGPQIKPLAGGAIEDAPVAYVDYQSKPLFAEYVSTVNTTLGLATLIVILIPFAIIVGYLYAMQDTR